MNQSFLQKWWAWLVAACGAIAIAAGLTMDLPAAVPAWLSWLTWIGEGAREISPGWLIYGFAAALLIAAAFLYRLPQETEIPAVSRPSSSSQARTVHPGSSSTPREGLSLENLFEAFGPSVPPVPLPSVRWETRQGFELTIRIRAKKGLPPFELLATDLSFLDGGEIIRDPDYAGRRAYITGANPLKPTALAGDSNIRTLIQATRSRFSVPNHREGHLDVALGGTVAGVWRLTLRLSVDGEVILSQSMWFEWRPHSDTPLVALTPKQAHVRSKIPESVRGRF